MTHKIAMPNPLAMLPFSPRKENTFLGFMAMAVRTIPAMTTNKSRASLSGRGDFSPIASATACILLHKSRRMMLAMMLYAIFDALDEKLNIVNGRFLTTKIVKISLAGHTYLWEKARCNVDCDYGCCRRYARRTHPRVGCVRHWPQMRRVRYVLLNLY